MNSRSNNGERRNEEGEWERYGEWGLDVWDQLSPHVSPIKHFFLTSMPLGS